MKIKNNNTTLLAKLAQFITDHYFEEPPRDFFRIHALHNNVVIVRLDFNVDEPFNQKLFKLIDASGQSDVYIYKKAGIDRRHFSKIKSSSDYVPQKKTIVAFSLALELSLKDAESLLQSAGYSLSDSHLFDVIIKFFLKERIFDIPLINEALLAHDQALIGF